MDILNSRRGFIAALAATGIGAAVAAPMIVTPALAQMYELPRLLPASTTKAARSTARTERAVLAGGCFWGVQGVFQHTKGVISAVSGYAGGEKGTAKYETVGTGRTGHAEAVEVVYDPAVLPYEEVLRVFFSVATDPTQLNRQGPDVGTQYRNVIFYTNPDQKRVAEAYIAQLNAAKAFRGKIVTTVAQAPFYRAEDYHQDYLTNNPKQPYIVIHDLPKIEALRKLFPDRYRASPVLVRKA